MATVVGIFEHYFKNGKKLPVVRPGTQTRKFTHVDDTIRGCVFAWKKNNCAHYSVARKESFSIIELANLFKGSIRYLPNRPGERYASALTKMNLNRNIIKFPAKIKLKSYIKEFIKNIS